MIKRASFQRSLKGLENFIHRLSKIITGTPDTVSVSLLIILHQGG